MYVKRRTRSSRPASTRKRSYRKKTYTKSARVTTGLKSYVKRAISRTEELKTQSFTANNIPMQAYAAGNLLTLDCNSVLGLISQGVGEGQRIGNKVTCKSFMIKGFINQLVAGAGQFPVLIKMFVGKLKFAISTTNGAYPNLYQAGNGVSPPQNNMFDLMRIINKDIFTVVKTKTFKIGTAGAPTINNDFSLVKSFSMNLTKHIGSLIYNDASANPTNKGLYIWFVCVLADGTVSVAVQAGYGISYDMEVKYSDA